MATDRAPALGRTAGIVLQVLAALVITAVLLATSELLAWRYLRSQQSSAPAGRGTEDTVTLTLDWLAINPAPLVPDVTLLWRNQPMARKTQPVNPQPFRRHDQWTIENSSEGFRGPERTAVDEHAKVFRILCIGDSITFGFNADQKDTYERQLEGLLKQRYPNTTIEIVNAGVSGWSWLQGLRFLETEGVGLRPDLILMGHGTNDQLLTARVTDEERFFRLGGRVTRWIERTRLLLSTTNTYQAIEHLTPRQRPTEDYSPGCKQQLLSDRDCRRVSLDQIEAAVHEVRRITDRNGIDLLLLNFDFTETRAVDAVRRAAERDGTPFLDLVGRLHRLRTMRETVFATRLGLAPSEGSTGTNDQHHPAPTVAVLRVAAPFPGAYGVRGSIDYRSGSDFNLPMYDDGTHGDEVAGDGVFSTSVPLPPGATSVSYKFYLGDTPELMPLPPFGSQHGNRRLWVSAHLLGPVDRFGRLLFMAEGAHPNAAGHRIIAKAIADRLRSISSFQRFVQ